MGANGATTTPYTLNGILQFLSVSTSVTLGGSLTVSSTTASTSPTTGSLVVGGGIGVAGAVYAGGVLSTIDDLVLSSTSGEYIGAALTDGTWRTRRSGSTLVFERRESGTYVAKLTLYDGSIGIAADGISASTIDASGRVTVGGSTPASAGATGATGTVTWDDSYIYICTATNTWKRVAIATW